MNELNPALLVITGDYMTSKGEEHIENVRELIQQLDKPPHGIIPSLDNHDYGPFWSDDKIAKKLVKMLEETGITVLRNEKAVIEGFHVVGSGDYWARDFKPLRIMPAINRDQASLVLSHNPATLDQAGWSEYSEWILSGHTH